MLLSDSWSADHVRRTLLAVALCANIVAAQGCRKRLAIKPPMDATYIKIPMCRVGGDCSAFGDNCHVSFQLCRLNDEPLPEPERWSSLSHEYNELGHPVSWYRRYTIRPGSAKLVVTGRGAIACEDESRLAAYLRELTIKMIFVPGAPVANIARVVGDTQREGPLLVEFEAKPGKSYMLGCSSTRTPWVWVIPEEEW